MSTDVVQLVSGGLDSELVSALYPNATRLFIDYGQPEAALEWDAVANLWPEASRLSVVGLAPSREGVYFPARNIALASLAVLYTDAKTVLMGGMADDYCADKTPEAFDHMSRILTEHSKHQVTIHSPFWKIEKSEAVRQYLAAGGDEKRLLKTFSCYTGREGGCGECPACFRWRVALLSNGVTVPLPGRSVTLDYLKRLHEYSPGRRWAILQALKFYGATVRAVDIDGVLTREIEGYDYARRTPCLKAIVAVRHWYEAGQWVILFSARREADRKVTVEWLQQHLVLYHALLLEKPPYSTLSDDATFDL